jgi:hypothetical protein
VLLMRGIYESRHRDGLRCHDIHAESHDDIIIIISGVRLSPLGTAATTGLLDQPQMIDDGDCGFRHSSNIKGIRPRHTSSG